MCKSCNFMRFSTILTALFCPYMAHERTAQNLILSVCSLRFALCLKEHHRSQNQGLLKSEDRLSDFKERCAQLCLIHILHRYMSYILLECNFKLEDNQNYTGAEASLFSLCTENYRQNRLVYTKTDYYN